MKNISKNQTTNIGIFKEDVFIICVLMNHNTTQALRDDRLKGKFKTLNEFKKYKEKYKHNLHY